MVCTESSFYVFVASDVQAGHESLASPEAIEERLKKGYWALRERAAYRKSLKAGDKVVFYAAGSGGSKFVATAILASECLHLPLREREKLEGKCDYLFAAPYGVRLDNSLIFDHPVPAKPLVEKLSFVGSSKKWGVYFQKAVIKMNEADLNLILSQANAATASYQDPNTSK